MSIRTVATAASVAALTAGSLVACGPGPREGNADADPSMIPDGTPADAGLPPFQGDVYAHSYQKLYKVDPDTLQVTLIGAFGWPGGPEADMMTDIAVDKDGRITGISFGGVYAVDKDTAECTFLAALTGQAFNGLTFLPQQDGSEKLIGTGKGGSLWEIDPATGNSTEVGAYGGAMTSSGDLVSVVGFGTVATVKNGSEQDYLARIDEVTGVGTVIGATGYPDIWGIGYWRNKVFGFVATNQFVLIDVATGQATYVSTGPENWAGAGVTTRAPIEQ